MRKKRRQVGIYVVLAVLLLIYVFPFYLVVINSFKVKRDVVKEPLSLIGKGGFVPQNYVKAMERMNFGRVLYNSIVITVISVILIVLFSSMAAYLFARFKWKINKVLFAVMIISMVIPFQVLMIPIVSIYGAQLHLLNSRWTLIFMHTGFGVSMGTFLLHGAIISSIPVALEEAATIDGAGNFKIYRAIVLPLLKPSIVTLVIIDALAIWNDYLLPSLILVRKDLYTIPIAAQSFHGDFSSDYGLMMAGMVLMIIPIMIMYVVLQKYIIEGVVAGAVKG